MEVVCLPSSVLMAVDDAMASDSGARRSQRRSVLTRVGCVNADGQQYGSAVSQLEPMDEPRRGLQGTVRFAQITRERCLIEATLEGFAPGPLSFGLSCFT